MMKKIWKVFSPNVYLQCQTNNYSINNLNIYDYDD